MHRFDVQIAAALFVLAQAESWLGPSIQDRPETAVAAGIATAALAWRRRWPLAVLIVVMTAFGALSVAAELPVAVFVLPTSLLAVYTVAACREAVAEARRLRPDVVVMDVRMPRMDGIAATRELLRGRAGEGPRVLVLTTFDLDEYVYEALRAGASGFLLKDAPPQRLVAAVHAVHEGDALLAPQITRRLVERYAAPAREAPGLDELTAREREVLTLVARGLSNAEIGETLVLSLPTVKTHVSRVLMKLGLRDRVQAVVLAYEAGIVTPLR